jgi:carboxyl-terminal processing protease
LAALIFSAGNLAAYLGVFDLGARLRLVNPISQGADDPEAAARATQLAARLQEVAALLDNEALAIFDQATLDSDTTTAIRTLLESSGDKYAHYFTPDEYAEYQRSSKGVYSGIGVVLTSLDGQVTVLEVYPDSPAQEAGIESGDVLVAIDGERRQWELAEATQAIQRDDGESVTIVWLRAGQERDTTVTLRNVTVPNCAGELKGEVGYIRLLRFNENSVGELETTLAKLDEQGAQAYVLDVRGNPGGLLSQAVGVTSLFVPQGLVVEIQDKRGTERRQVSGEAVTEKPLIYLVNGQSASASELVAAALRDHGRATIVGEVTYGKGTVQDLRELSFGGALRYTIAHYFSPDGHAIDGIGVTPDIVVLAGDAGQGDPQLDAALRVADDLIAGRLP